MCRQISIWLCLVVVGLAGSAQATVSFYIDWNCGSYNFSRSGGQITNLKEITYTYGCWRDRTVGHGEIDITYWGTCTKNFNDNVRSVKISDSEDVEIFKHADFKGNSEYIDRGNGCYNLQILPDQGSSIRIRR